MSRSKASTHEAMASTEVDYKLVDYNLSVKITIHGVKFIIEGGSIITSRKNL